MAGLELQIVKAGWLHRRSTVLHRWKKNWFVLYRHGELAYFENQDKYEPEGKLIVYATCLRIKTAGACDFSPPEGSSKMCLLELELRSDDNLKLCAESADDMRAWQIALEEARTMNGTGVGTAPPVVPYPSGVVYPNTIPYGYGGHVITPPGTYVVHDASGSGGPMVVGGQPGTQVVYLEEPRYCYRRYPFYGPVFWW